MWRWMLAGALVVLAGCPSPDPTCDVNGVIFPDGALDPNASCFRCKAAKSTTHLTRLGDGALCAGGGHCAAGACIQGCQVGGVSYAANTVDPENPCQYCLPAVSTFSWSVAADGTGCGDVQACLSGVCTGGSCLIGDVTYAAGAANPSNPCQRCDPATPRVWANAQLGQSCGAGAYCAQGTCVTGGCFVDGQVVANGTVKTLGCGVCDAATSTTTWKAYLDGTACTGGKCAASVCVRSCTIDGVSWASGATNPVNTCLTCQPTTDTLAWSPVAEGLECAGGKCSGGQCVQGCLIGGTFYGIGVLNPTNACQHCDPSQRSTDWTAVPTGTLCSTGHVCISTQCLAGCFIDGTQRASNEVNPSNPCQVCTPALHTSGWSTRQGTGCADAGP